jgi:predicted nucleic acid-binding Zn ribbon protein
MAPMAPQTPLAAVQTVWAEAVGAKVAERAQAVAERDGVVTVSCDSAAWAQELDLMHDEVLARLNSALGESAAGDPAVRGLRFTADLPRHES